MVEKLGARRGVMFGGSRQGRWAVSVGGGARRSVVGGAAQHQFQPTAGARRHRCIGMTRRRLNMAVRRTEYLRRDRQSARP